MIAALKNISIVANLTNFTLLAAFVMINLAVIVLRYREAETPRPFRVWGNLGKFPIIPFGNDHVAVHALLRGLGSTHRGPGSGRRRVVGLLGAPPLDENQAHRRLAASKSNAPISLSSDSSGPTSFRDRQHRNAVQDQSLGSRSAPQAEKRPDSTLARSKSPQINAHRTRKPDALARD